MVKPAEELSAAQEPGLQRSSGELSPEEEKEWERLDKQGEFNAATARDMASGGRLAVTAEVQLDTIDADTDEAEAARIVGRKKSSDKKSGFPLGPKRKMRPRTRAWGEKASSDDGLTPQNN